MSETLKQLLETPPPAIPLAVAAKAALDCYGLIGEISPLSGERDANFLLRPAVGAALVLKFSNAMEEESTLSFQIALMGHLAHRSSLPVPHIHPTRDGAPFTSARDANGDAVFLHAITLLPGVPARGQPGGETFRRNIGHALGEMARAVEGFHHKGAERTLLWDCMQAPGLRGLLPHVEDRRRRAFIAGFLDRFEQQLAPAFALLPRQVIHNDLSPSNPMIASAGDYRITGVLDFGDAVLAPRVCDLAVAASYHLDDSENPFGTIAGMLAAYEAVTPLTPAEREALPDLILARLAVRTVINEWRSARFPGNRAYIERTMHHAWALLDRFIVLARGSSSA